MKKAKKKREIISADAKKKIRENMSKYGMNPYNAAVTAGLSHEAAEAFQKKSMFKIMFRNGIDDLAERNYASVYARMNWLSRKSGLHPDSDGCQKTVSAGESFVNTDDNTAQIACVREINSMTDTGSGVSGGKDVVDSVLNVRIVLSSSDKPKDTTINITGTDTRSTT